MTLDPHVHTAFSGPTSIYPLSLVMNESYNSPEGVYRRAKARGMDSLLFDLVARPAPRLPEAA